MFFNNKQHILILFKHCSVLNDSILNKLLELIQCVTLTLVCIEQFVITFVPKQMLAYLCQYQLLAIPKKALIAFRHYHTETIHYQLSPEELVQDTLRIGEGVLNDTGALVINTGEFTGRSPKR